MPKIVPHVFYKVPNGASFSRYSSHIPSDAQRVEQGYTIEWEDGTSGTGSKPFATAAEAQAFIDRNPRFRGMSAATN